MRTSLLFLCLMLALQLSAKDSFQPKFELRAVWVATVNNIDWPSKPGLSIKQQQEEALALLNQMDELNMNAVFLQIRPASDAFYPSNLEPWSRYLTGTSGEDPGWDPLQFWIQECHKRQMELHAWMNPFRVAQSAKEALSVDHIAFKHPEWIIQYGGKLYFNPALDETRQFIAAVVKDVVTRYDVDGIHFDDYFYPYPVQGEVFPDAIQFAANPRQFGPDQLEDWRRNNVELTIQLLAQTIKATKPWVKFGISPFGVWRNVDKDPRGSMTRGGVTNYDDLYADILKWVQYGWIDYVTPQLYWERTHAAANYITLCKWWAENCKNRDVYIGHGLYKIEADSKIEAWRQPDEMPQQIALTRETPGIKGSAFYSAVHLKRNLLGLQDSLQQDLYRLPALCPPMPWIDHQPPGTPAKFKAKRRRISWEKPNFKKPTNEAIRYIVYRNKVGKKLDMNDARSIYAITSSQEIKLAKRKGKKERFEFRVTALDHTNNESAPTKAETVKW